MTTVAGVTLRKALVVDDDADVRTIAQLALSVDGTVEVAACGDGESAIAIAAEFLPDVILLDVMMPNLDGPKTLARIRAIELLAKVPIIFLTAHAMPSKIRHLLSLDAAAVLAKPFEPMGLLPKVRAICHSAQRTPEREPSSRQSTQAVSQSISQPVSQPVSRSLTPNLRQRLIRDATELTTLAQQWAAASSEELDPIVAAAAHCTHKLHGAAAILGAPDIGTAAGRVNATLKALMRAEHDEREVLPAIRGLIELLERASA